MSSGMTFWDIILGLGYVLRYFGMKLYYENRFVSVEKEIKLLIGPKHFISQFAVEKENNRFSSQNIVISSQNNVPKYHPG